MDEQTTQEASLPPLDLPPRAVAAPLEAHLAKIHTPIVLSGVVENGVVRPLDPNARLSDGAQVIIVAAQSDATTIGLDLPASTRRRTALYWRVCGYVSIAWIVMGFLEIAARFYIEPNIAEPNGPLTLKLALWLKESGILLPLAATVTVPGAIAFFRRSRGRSFRWWFGGYSLLIMAFNLLCVALLEFIQRAGMISYPDGSFRRYFFPPDDKFGLGLVAAIPWFLFVLGQFGAWAIQLWQRWRRRVSIKPLAEEN